MSALNKAKPKLLLTILSCILVVSCANVGTAPSSIVIANGQLFNIVFPELPNGVLTQSLVAHHANNKHELLIHIEISPTQINFVGLSPSGLDLFTIHWPKQGDIQYSKRPFVPDDLRPEFMLADFLLTFSNQSTLQKQLPTLHIKEQADGHGKIRSFNQGQQGLIIIEYDSLQQWPQQVHFDHIQRGYQLTINTLEWEAHDSN